MVLGKSLAQILQAWVSMPLYFFVEADMIFVQSTSLLSAGAKLPENLETISVQKMQPKRNLHYLGLHPRNK